MLDCTSSYFNFNLVTFVHLLKTKILTFLFLKLLLFDGATFPSFASENKLNLDTIYNPIDNEVKEQDLSQRLAIINQMEDSHLKVMLLNNLALSYLRAGKINEAKKILKQSLSIIENLEDITLKITGLTNIANNYYQIGNKKKALGILADVRNLVKYIDDEMQQSQWLLNLSFEYAKMKEKDKAESLFSQSQILMAEASQPSPEFPFKETSSNFKLGVTGNINSFRDTTGVLGLDIDYAKQWTTEDILVDGNIYFSYDSSRSVNNYRPGSLMLAVYRHHFDQDWNFFVDFFNSTNESLFSASTNDEDLTIITSLWLGAGLNLWRGDSNQEFLDFQVGVGPRYEYDYIDFEQRKNETSPTLGIIFLGRGFSLGKSKIDQTFAIVPALDDFDDYIMSSNTQLSFPLTDRWSFTNRLFLRYRSEQILENNPRLNVFFSTGIEYDF